MNKNIHKLVFDKKRGMLVAVGEDVTPSRKVPGEANGAGATRRLLRLTPIAFVAWAICGDPTLAQVLPSGGRVVGGQSTISSPNVNTLLINQTSQRSVIDWNSFNVGQGNTVQFIQPNAQSQSLNRVVGGSASNIQGALRANGQVFIQNPNGVIFGKNATVDVGAILATTKQISASDFMNGNQLVLSRGAGATAATVENQGSIKAAPGGYVVLMGDQVRNSGMIGAERGQAVLAAGDTAVVSLANGQGIQVGLTSATAKALVDNSGQIQASNGSVLLTARGADTLLQTVINLSGVVTAESGAVVLDAGNTGDSVMSGAIDVAGRAPGARGGTVVLGGSRIGLFGNATVDARGDVAGGQVIIGGDSLKKIPGSSAANLIGEIGMADYTQIDAGATVRTGSAHGDGGFVETSGHSLSVNGTFDGAAPNGRGSQWLIDPTDVTISSAADSGYSGGITGGFNTGGGATANVNNATIANALNVGSTVTITTAGTGPSQGDISVIAPVVGVDGSLTLVADNNFTTHSAISAPNLNISANNIDIAPGGTIRIAETANITSYNFLLHANHTINVEPGAGLVSGPDFYGAGDSTGHTLSGLVTADNVTVGSGSGLSAVIPAYNESGLGSKVVANNVTIESGAYLAVTDLVAKNISASGSGAAIVDTAWLGSNVYGSVNISANGGIIDSVHGTDVNISATGDLSLRKVIGQNVTVNSGNLAVLSGGNISATNVTLHGNQSLSLAANSAVAGSVNTNITAPNLNIAGNTGMAGVGNTTVSGDNVTVGTGGDIGGDNV
ncbi:filamentous hemagglutinin N-terminal domain-containing protein, partial [Burkholderia reimsis]|uniref:two-partner secretion domain-containing protein n=1 Tax=Burkholderia reimsis TaxID=2234132 RepID=UPI001058DEDD